MNHQAIIGSKSQIPEECMGSDRNSLNTITVRFQGLQYRIHGLEVLDWYIRMVISRTMHRWINL